jgi:hypothetical protein
MKSFPSFRFLRSFAEAIRPGVGLRDDSSLTPFSSCHRLPGLLLLPGLRLVLLDVRTPASKLEELSSEIQRKQKMKGNVKRLETCTET